MAKTIKSTDQEQVTKHIKKLEPELGNFIQTLREIILSTDQEIGEGIKWNNPSFYFMGEMKPFDPKEYKRESSFSMFSRAGLCLFFQAGRESRIIQTRSGVITKTAEESQYSMI
jgi:hypothetical protein